LGWRAEGVLVGPLGLRDPGGDADVLDRASPLDRVEARPRRRDREVLGGLEHDRLLVRGPDRADLGLPGGDLDRLGRRSREPEAKVRSRGDGRLHLDPEQVEQCHVELLRDAVQPVDDRLGHPREQLDERDPRVGDVVLRPLRAALREAQARLVHEILEAAVVEGDLRDPAHSGSDGIT
jgi:hypothetical protein